MCNILLYSEITSLQHAISSEPRISFFASAGYLLEHRCGRIVCCVVEFNIKQLFIHKPD